MSKYCMYVDAGDFDVILILSKNESEKIMMRWDHYLKYKLYKDCFEPEGGCCGQSQCMVCAGIIGDLKIIKTEELTDMELSVLEKYSPNHISEIYDLLINESDDEFISLLLESSSVTSPTTFSEFIEIYHNHRDLLIINEFMTKILKINNDAELHNHITKLKLNVGKIKSKFDQYLDKNKKYWYDLLYNIVMDSLGDTDDSTIEWEEFTDYLDNKEISVDDHIKFIENHAYRKYLV